MVIDIDYEAGHPETYKGVEVWAGQSRLKRLFSGDSAIDITQALMYVYKFSSEGEVYYGQGFDQYVLDVVESLGK